MRFPASRSFRFHRYHSASMNDDSIFGSSCRRLSCTRTKREREREGKQIFEIHYRRKRREEASSGRERGGKGNREYRASGKGTREDRMVRAAVSRGLFTGDSFDRVFVDGENSKRFREKTRFVFPPKPPALSLSRCAGNKARRIARGAQGELCASSPPPATRLGAVSFFLFLYAAPFTVCPDFLRVCSSSFARAMCVLVFPPTFLGSLANVKVKTRRRESCYWRSLCKKFRKTSYYYFWTAYA